MGIEPNSELGKNGGQRFTGKDLVDLRSNFSVFVDGYSPSPIGEMKIPCSRYVPVERNSAVFIVFGVLKNQQLTCFQYLRIFRLPPPPPFQYPQFMRFFIDSDAGLRLLCPIVPKIF
jgi:hypothetical protein